LLIIRKAQMEALQRKQVLDFEQRSALRIRGQYPDDCVTLGDEGILNLIRYTMHSGAAWGIHSEHALNGLMQLYIEFGRELELAPYRQWALQLLGHRKLPGAIKVNLIKSRLFGLTQGRRMVRHTETGEA
jgi:hypothetical protein